MKTKQKVIDAARKLCGQHLKTIREEKGISVWKIAQKSGCSIKNIHNIEEGNGYHIDSFFRYIAALDVFFYLAERNGKDSPDIEGLLKNLNKSITPDMPRKYE